MSSPILQVALGLMTLTLIACGPSVLQTTPSLTSAPLDLNTLLHKGEEVYTQSCALCHYAGEGSEIVPSLMNSEIVKKSPDHLIKIILKGQRGISKINGQKINGIMPGHSTLTDTEVAAVATYVRNTFAKKAQPIQPTAVTPLR